MSTDAAKLGIAGVKRRDEAVEIFTPARQNSVIKDTEMPGRRANQDDDSDLHRLVRQEVRDAIYDRGNTRSVDTLRRDIGIFAILLAMMVQTGAAFYWAGGVTRGQESQTKTTEQMQQEQAYIRAQLQLIDGKLQKIEGREAERERQKGR